MSTKKIFLECKKVDNSIDKVIVNKCYNLDLPVGSLYYQVSVVDSVTLSSVPCYSFASFEDAISFVRKKFDL